MMNPALKVKWIEALRSGKYRQGHNLLHNAANNTYCCLGVLLDVASITYSPDNGEKKRGDGYKKIRELVRGENVVHLAIMNDNGESFSKIADYIEHVHEL